MFSACIYVSRELKYFVFSINVVCPGESGDGWAGGEAERPDDGGDCGDPKEGVR
jgi:hypothetical protein